MTPNARFSEFITDITPRKTTNDNSISAHSRVREALFADDEFKDQVKRVILGGSYKRSTAIRPKTKQGSTERPDVDLYVIVDGSPFWASPEDLTEDLFEALNRARDDLGITKLKRNRCSIAVSMTKADLDVSILLERQSDNLYRIGNRETGEWYKTDPEEHTDWSADQNTRFSRRFNPLVRMAKWARRENKTVSKHPKSFAHEVFISLHADETEPHYGKLFHGYCAAFVDAYWVHRTLGIRPNLSDPAVPGGDILSGVSGEAFCAYYDKVKKHRDDAEKALEEEDQDRATDYWRRIFGDRFPAPKSATKSALRPAAAMSPLTFRSAQVAPSPTPAKFA